jgi:hypothetical protein
MSNTVKIVFFSDAGHGWGRVPHSLITELGIADKISEFSYQDRDYVYLEEDCDLSLCIHELTLAGFREHIVHRKPVNRSSIRKLPRYEALKTAA